MPTRRSLARAGGALSVVASLYGCSSSGSSSSPSDGGGSLAPDAQATTAVDAGVDATFPDDGAAPPEEDAAGDGPIAVESDDAARPTYLNPVVNQDFPDPFILRQGGTYYAFATNAAGKNIQSATSADLAHWTVLGDALPTLPAWAEKNASLTWAPSILQRGPSSFVMYYTTRDTASGFQCISHAESTTPGGPYVDSTTSAFVCQVSGAQSLCGSIDPSPFVDSDGTAYLVWKSDENSAACSDPPRLWSAQLSADGTTLTGPANQLLIMDETWQQPIIEGPSMTAVNGAYYLAYSANNYESAAYSMGYATCLSPTGPCENVSINGPFVSSAGSALGPGGGEFFSDADGGRWLVYHAWTAPETSYTENGAARSMRIDRLQFDGGVLSLSGPTTTIQPL